MSQQQFPDDAGASLPPAAQPCGAVEPAPVAAVPPPCPPVEQPAGPSDKPAQPADKPGQPAGEPDHQPHAPVEFTDQELELLDQPIELPINPTPFGASPARLGGRGPTPARRLVSPQEAAASNRKLTPEQKLLILDTWQRSGLPVTDFAALVGINRVTLYGWKKRFEELGPAGLEDQPRKKPPGKIPDLTKRTILMLKKANPQWGCQRISDVLYRGPGLPASANSVAAILREAGYVLEEQPTTPHPDKVRSFERARPNQLWQTDLFTFVLKRQNRRVYLVAFMDDHSRTQRKPKAPFYIAGQVNGKPFSVHSEGERLFMIGEQGQRTEIDLATAQQIAGPSAVEQTPKADLPEPVTAHGLVNADLQHEAEPGPGTSPLDEPLQRLHQSLGDGAAASEVSPIPEGGDL